MSELISNPAETAAAADDRRRFLRRSAAVLGAGAVAATLRAQTTTPTPNPDIAALNFALTLENLEAAFYVQGLTRFTAADFGRSTAASVVGTGISGNIYPYLQRIRDHETTHVTTLNTVIKSLGGTPVAPCTYSFPYQTPDDFLNVAALLENTGVMAYDGALALIQSKDLQTAGATIATVEARHAAYLNLLTGAIPFPTAFDMAKSMTEILAAANQFITGCPTASGGTTPVATMTAAVLMPKGLTTASPELQLDARTSASATGQPLTYSVRQVGGASASILNATTAQPTVQFSSGFGTYTFELTVTDSAGTVARDTTAINYVGR